MTSAGKSSQSQILPVQPVCSEDALAPAPGSDVAPADAPTPEAVQAGGRARRPKSVMRETRPVVLGQTIAHAMREGAANTGQFRSILAGLMVRARCTFPKLTGHHESLMQEACAVALTSDAPAGGREVGAFIWTRFLSLAFNLLNEQKLHAQLEKRHAEKIADGFGLADPSLRAPQPDPDEGTADRADIIRFALMDLFCVRRHTETLARALLDEAAKASSAFPGRAIYARLREAGETLVENHLPTPDEFASTVLDDSTDPSRDVLQNERLLAMWVQRQWLARWFPHFDPTLFARAEDLPFDLDHIVPAAHINMRGRGWHVSSQFEAWREGLSNSVGNFRYWPKGENRADGEANPGKKHLLGDAIAELPDDATLRRPPYGLRTYAEVRAASYIPEDIRDDWAGASTGTGGNYDWKDEKRILAWRRAVMKRRTAMYREVFTVLDFAAWTMGADARPQLQAAEVA